MVKYFGKTSNKPPKGAIVAIEAGDQVVLAASVTAPGDQFSYQIAKNIAVGRANKKLTDPSYKNNLVKVLSSDEFNEDTFKKVSVTAIKGVKAIVVGD